MSGTSIIAKISMSLSFLQKGMLNIRFRRRKH